MSSYGDPSMNRIFEHVCKSFEAAVRCDDQEAYEDALRHYIDGLEYLKHVIEYEKSPQQCQVFRSKFQEYAARAETIKTYLCEKNKNKNKNKKGKGKTATASKGGRFCLVTAATDSEDQADTNRVKRKQDGEKQDEDEQHDSPEVAEWKRVLDNDLEQMKRMDALTLSEEQRRVMLELARSGVMSHKRDIKVRWGDVVGLDRAKEMMREALVLPLELPSVFQHIKEWKSILLYGPPGTGKTELSKAVACEISACFFSVGSSDLISKWQGESEKYVKALFDLAHIKQPSVVFVDEIDSLCSSRGDSNESEASRRVKNQFLVQMSGNNNNNGGSRSQVFVMGATNRPWDLDEAMLRRFDKRIHVDLPCERARRQIFVNLLSASTLKHTLSASDLDSLARKTDGYSGSDIRLLAQEVIMSPVRKIVDGTHFKAIQVSSVSTTAASSRTTASTQAPTPLLLLFDESSSSSSSDTTNNNSNSRNSTVTKYTPCSPGGRAAVWRRDGDIAGATGCAPPFGVFRSSLALRSTKPSVDPDSLARYQEWTARFGLAS